MSDAREDQRLRSALEGLRQIAPREEEVVAVLRRAAAPRHSTGMRTAAASLALVLVVLGVMLAVPPGRSALAAAVDRLESFLGGGDAPGSVLPSGEPANALNWLEDATPGSPRVLAKEGALRLVAFRQKGSGHFCFSLSRSVTECGDRADWQVRFAGEAIAILTTTRTDSPERVALWGLATDAVTSVELSYRAGPTLTATVATNGFVIVAPAGRVPEALIARDAGGVVVARADVADLQWRFCTSIRGCP